MLFIFTAFVYLSFCAFLRILIPRDGSRYTASIIRELLQSFLTLCNPMDCSTPGSSVHDILQARILEWVAMLSSRGSSQPEDQTHVSYVSCIGR